VGNTYFFLEYLKYRMRIRYQVIIIKIINVKIIIKIIKVKTIKKIINVKIIII